MSSPALDLLALYKNSVALADIAQYSDREEDEIAYRNAQQAYLTAQALTASTHE